MPSKQEDFMAELERLMAEAKRLISYGFDAQEPEEATKTNLLEPLFEALGYRTNTGQIREFKILGDSVDYLLKSDRPLIFVEAKSLHDCPKTSLFEKHREQVMRYIQNYRLSPEVTRMDRPVAWILLTNFAQLHFIRVNETTPTFSFKLADLWERRNELWELLALENLDANRIDEVYDQQKKAILDQQFLADLKRWRLLIANGFALRQQERSLEDMTLASQQLLDRFIFCRMLETRRLVEYNKLARSYNNYWVLFARADKNFSEVVRESLFVEIKKDFNTELFEQPLLCDALEIDNAALAAVIGHEPLSPELAATCGFEMGQGELIAFRHLYSYDFSLMSQDVMGAVYERFLAHKLVQNGGRIVIEDTDELRKKEGIYYTPKYIVDYIVAHTLGEKIKPILNEAKTLLGYKNFKGALVKIRELSEIKVLDPAMGSGSFLLVAFDTLIDAYAEYNADCRRIKKDRNGNGALFDADLALAEEVLDAPLHVLTENIFGVDLDQQAVKVAKLNLWLRYMTVNRDPFLDRLQRKQRGGKPLRLLPNLTKNLKCGNSLIADVSIAGDAAFDWKGEFVEIMKSGGFEVVIGNPPYHMLQPHDTSDKVLGYFREHFVKAEFKIDLFHLFLQRAVLLLKQGSYLGYIIPTSILNNVYAESLRRWLLDQCSIERIAVSRNQVFADADVHTSILILRREENEAARDRQEILITDDFHKMADGTAVSYSRARQSRFQKISGCVWNILLNEANAKPIERMSKNAVPLQKLATINRGLITGNRGEFFTKSKKTEKHVEIIEGGDVQRYFVSPPSNFVLFERPASAGGCWEREVHFASHKIVIRQIAEKPTASLLNRPIAVTGNVFTMRAGNVEEELYILSVINSRLTAFFWKTMFADFKTSFPQVTVFSLEQLPIRTVHENDKSGLKRKKDLVTRAKAMLDAQQKFHNITPLLGKKILHANRTPCNLAHYLQKDFAAEVTWNIVIDDVQRVGFVHDIRVESKGREVTLNATLADTQDGEARATPVLRLEFKDEALRQFVYACWRRFLEEHARQKKWTKGKKPEAIYPLLVNSLEPLVYFEAAAGDNLRAIQSLMKAVAEEAGSADLAAVEAEIERLDREIDERVFELYELTPEEIEIVRGAR